MSDIRLSINVETFAYPDGTAALSDIRLEVARGEMTGILGANGSGKTTLLKVMDGLIRDYRGTVLLDGEEVRRLHPRDIYRRMGLVFQNPDDQLFAHTVFEDVAFGPRNMKFPEAEVEKRVYSALEAVDMEESGRKSINALSYGQKKRICIAGLLAMGHEILLLDEPTAGLDPAGEIRMLELLFRLNREREVTVVMATHGVDLAPLFMHRLHVLNKGRLVRSGTPQEVFTTAEEMAEVKLRLPYVAELFQRLAGEGASPAPKPLTMDEVLAELRRMVRP